MIQNKKVVGIVVAKNKSSRLPGKNYYPVDGYPMFWHSVSCLLNSKYVDKVYVATDDEDNIASYCKERGVNVIKRGINSSQPEEPLFDVIKFSYKSIDSRYDIVANIMANSIGHQPGDLDNAIELLVAKGLKEVRSYSEENVENGILILDSSVVFEKHQLSSYVGMIQNNAKEIHYINDLP
jgi:CMP-N-acetylneuraminic acid synthetase